LMLLPFVAENLASKTKDFEKVHPELQVIIADLSFVNCLSKDELIRNNAARILNKFSNSNYSSVEICKDFRLNNWASVGSWYFNSSELGLKSYNPEALAYSKIVISSNLSEDLYIDIRNSWIKLVFENPKEYIQVKFLQANQVLTSGDSFRFRLLSAYNFKTYLAGVVFLPFDILISLHLLSPLMTLLIGFCIVLTNLSNFKIGSVIRNPELIFANIFVLFWIALTTIAYIGDNGRYTYLSSFVYYFLLVRGIDKLKNTISHTKFAN